MEFGREVLLVFLINLFHMNIKFKYLVIVVGGVDMWITFPEINAYGRYWVNGYGLTVHMGGREKRVFHRMGVYGSGITLLRKISGLDSKNVLNVYAARGRIKPIYGGTPKKLFAVSPQFLQVIHSFPAVIHIKQARILFVHGFAPPHVGGIKAYFRTFVLLLKEINSVVEK